jgi:hypothetical protein
LSNQGVLPPGVERVERRVDRLADGALGGGGDAVAGLPRGVDGLL